MNSNKIILDLCGGTGGWSQPYKEAGYQIINVTLPFDDVRKWANGEHGIEEEVYGILAAPPCTMFSLARTTAKIPRDIEAGLEAVKACMQIIWKYKPKFWAMENPRGLLRKYMGKPAFTFDPSEFNEEYNKTTDLWGYFNFPEKRYNYIRYDSTEKNTRKLPPVPVEYVRDPSMTAQAIRRSITPQRFAQAFYKANL